VNSSKYYYGDKIKENEVGEACSMYRSDEICTQKLAGNPEGKSDFENLGVNRRTILKLILKKLCEVID
jgi:hypothetical protein